MDIIVEHAVLVAVFVEQSEGIGVGKVFELDEAIDSEPVGRGKTEEKKCVITSWSGSYRNWIQGRLRTRAEGNVAPSSYSFCRQTGSATPRSRPLPAP